MVLVLVFLMIYIIIKKERFMVTPPKWRINMFGRPSPLLSEESANHPTILKKMAVPHSYAASLGR